MKAPAEMSPVELAAAFSKIAGLEAYIKDIRDRAMSEALAGRCMPGYKLVAGRGYRKWRPEVEAIMPPALSKTVLIGIGEAEERFGKNHEIFTRCTIMGESKPALAHESDKRPALRITTAQEDFAK